MGSATNIDLESSPGGPTGCRTQATQDKDQPSSAQGLRRQSLLFHQISSKWLNRHYHQVAQGRAMRSMGHILRTCIVLGKSTYANKQYK
jgi:hypothetical protein